MDVPFISCVHRKLNGGTEVMAPPGAQTVTPRSPSIVGPRLVQVYGVPGSFSLVEYKATIISGETYAPTPFELKIRIKNKKKLMLCTATNYDANVRFVSVYKLRLKRL